MSPSGYHLAERGIDHLTSRAFGKGKQIVWLLAVVNPLSSSD